MSEMPPYPPPLPGSNYIPQGGTMVPAGPAVQLPTYAGQSIPVPSRTIWGIRIGAYFIDSIVCGAISYLIFFLIIATSIATIASGRQAGPGVLAAGWIVLLVIAYFFLPVLYGTLCIGVWGRTLGMLMVGVRVVDETAGGPIGFGRAFARSIVFYVLFLLCVIPGVINLFSPLWDVSGQAWHDKAARSRVVIQP